MVTYGVGQRGRTHRKYAGARTGRWGEATHRMHMGMGVYITVQTRGWIFSRQEVEARIGKLENGEYAAIMQRYSELRAQQLQAEVVRALEEGRIQSRKSVSTGRLAAALAAPENRIVRPFAYGVGVPAWLERSQAKYWRQIDQGFTGHVGRQIYTFGERSAPLQSVRQRRGGESGGAFASSRRRWVAGTPGTLGASVQGDFGGFIKRPIVEQRYFQRAWEALNLRELAVQDLEQAISEILRN